jgi:hypothetical protein
MNDKAQFGVEPKRYCNSRSFYSVDEFLLSKNFSKSAQSILYMA